MDEFWYHNLQPKKGKSTTKYYNMSTTTTPSNGATQPDPWQQKELGVFWERTKKGTTESYLTGTINLKALGFDKDVPVIVFTNKHKKKSTHPDLRMYISEKPQGRSDAAPAAAKEGRPASAPAPKAAVAPKSAPVANPAASNELI